MTMKTTIRNVSTVDVPGRMPYVTKGGHLVRDVLLTPPTPEEWAAYAKTTARVDLGKVWSGAFEPVLDALSPRDREHLFARLDTYREMQAGIDVGSLFSDRFKGNPASTDTNPDEGRFLGRTAKDTANTTADINARNKAFWDKRLGR
jgi:hypothetical protein